MVTKLRVVVLHAVLCHLFPGGPEVEARDSRRTVDRWHGMPKVRAQRNRADPQLPDYLVERSGARAGLYRAGVAGLSHPSSITCHPHRLPCIAHSSWRTAEFRERRARLLSLYRLLALEHGRRIRGCSSMFGTQRSRWNQEAGHAIRCPRTDFLRAICNSRRSRFPWRLALPRRFCAQGRSLHCCRSYTCLCSRSSLSTVHVALYPEALCRARTSARRRPRVRGSCGWPRLVAKQDLLDAFEPDAAKTVLFWTPSPHFVMINRSTPHRRARSASLIGA